MPGKRFKTGDIVQLKSGGPKMTVQGYEGIHARYVECQWFAGSKLSEGSFEEDTLQLVTDEEPKKS